MKYKQGKTFLTTLTSLRTQTYCELSPLSAEKNEVLLFWILDKRQPKRSLRSQSIHQPAFEQPG